MVASRQILLEEMETRKSLLFIKDTRHGCQFNSFLSLCSILYSIHHAPPFIPSLTQMKFVRLPIRTIAYCRLLCLILCQNSRVYSICVPIPCKCTSTLHNVQRSVVVKCYENLANVYWFSLFVLRF